MRRGYTLVEILISVSLSLFLLLGVTRLFQSVGTSITDAQGTLIMTRNLDWVATTLRNDLDNLTVDVNKPSKLANASNPPSDSDGYFQIIEGNQTFSDPTVGDVDDILMFTARAPADTQFRGLIGGVGNVRESPFAEIIWFVRGNTLYRRVLLILDNNTPLPTTVSAGFYRSNDISVHLDGTNLVPNTLPDLAQRENRFGHTSSGTFPFPPYGTATSSWDDLRMPTLAECSDPTWPAGGPLTTVTVSRPSSWDLWENPNLIGLLPTGAISAYPNGNRVGEDIILTNVISFDVKVWHPCANGNAGGYVDIGDGSCATPGCFGTIGRQTDIPRVYDTWSSTYAQPAPYEAPLRGIEVTIRCFDPRSKNIKQIRIVKDFN